MILKFCLNFHVYVRKEIRLHSDVLTSLFWFFFFATSLTVLTQLFKLSKHQDIYSLNVFLLCKITDLSRLFYHFLLNCDWEMWQFLMNTLDTDKYFINVAQRNRKRCNAPVKKGRFPIFSPDEVVTNGDRYNTDWGEVHRGIATWIAPPFLETRSEKSLTS